MNCPKCGHAQAGDQECERCGVIFARLQKREEALPNQAGMEPSVVPRKASSGLAGWVVAMVVGVLGGWYVFAPSQQQPAPDTGQPAAISSQEGEQEGRRAQSSPPSLRQGGVPDQPQGAEGLAGKLAAAFPAGNALEQARNATVFIKTPWGSGSGFFVTANGYIVTNRHVVEVDAAQRKSLKDDVDKMAAELERDLRNREVLERQLASIRDPGVRRQVEESLQRGQEAREKYSALHQEKIAQLQRIERSSWSSDIKIVLIDGSELPVQSLKMSDRADLALLSVDCYNAPFIQPVTDSRHFGQGAEGLFHRESHGIAAYRDRRDHLRLP